MFAEHVPGPSRTGRERDHHPAGHRPRGRGVRAGVRVHRSRRRARPPDGRFRDGGRRARHRAAAGSPTSPGRVRGGTTATDTVTDGRPPSARGLVRAPAASTGGHPASADPASQDHGHPDAVAVDAKLSAAVRRAQVLGPANGSL